MEHMQSRTIHCTISTFSVISGVVRHARVQKGPLWSNYVSQSGGMLSSRSANFGETSLKLVEI